MRPIAKVDEGGSIIHKYKSISEAAHRTGVSVADIRQSLEGKCKAAGFYWIDISAGDSVSIDRLALWADNLEKDAECLQDQSPQIFSKVTIDAVLRGFREKFQITKTII